MIDNGTIEFVQGKYGEFGNAEQRRIQLQEEEEIKIELKEKLSKGEITHEEYLQQYDEQVKGSFRSLNQIDNFKLDNDINIGEVYFVTREKQNPEYPDDKYLCYEIYDRNSGKLIADTDRDNNINFYDQKLLDKFPQLEDQAKKMFVMAKMNEKTGKAEDKIVVKNSVDYEQENKLQLAQDIKNDKEHTVYNDIDKDRELTYGEPDENEKEAENEQQLLEKANKEKTNKKTVDDNKEKREVIEAKLIEDPSVRDNIPDATAKTWMVRYEDGTLGMLNGRGEELESVKQITQADKGIDKIEKRGDDNTRIQTTFAIKGRENGIVFPATLENNQMQLSIQDREQNPQIAIPVKMQGYTETRDNKEFIKAQEVIQEILSRPEYEGLLKNEPEIANKVLEMCYAQNGADYGTIEKNVEFLNNRYIQENLDKQEDHNIPEEHEILTPEEEALRRINGNN